jgi:predicted DNA-binding transcriptional regulator AlpA
MRKKPITTANSDSPLALMTRRELAADLGVTTEQLCRLDSQRLGPPFLRLGRRSIRYSRAAVAAWLKEQQAR